MIGVNTSIFKSAGRKLVNLLGALKDRATYYENGTDSVAEKNRIDDLGVLDKATILLLTPTATSDARVHSVKTYTGDELVTNGTFDTDSNWTKTTGWGISNGNASYDGSGTGYQYVSQAITTTSGGTYKINFDVLSSTGSNLNIVDFGSVRVNQTHLTEGNYTYYAQADASSENLTIYANGTDTFSIDNVSVKDVSSDFDFDRASSATRINSDGLVQDIVSDLARINYDSNGENGHILLEPTSTNLITYSEDFSSHLLGSNSTLTYESDVVAPDGSLGVYRLQNPATASTYINTGTFTAQSMSVWVKAKTVGTDNQFTIYRDGASLGASDVKTATGDWQRFNYSWSSSSTGNYYINNEGDGYGSDIYIWGAQVENLPYTTSYIPTLTGSAVTRATETLTGSGNSTLINSTEGVLYAEINALSYPTDLNSWLTITDGTASNSVGIVFETTPYITGRVEVGGVNQAYLANNVDYSNFVKVAVKYKANDFALWINGVEVATDTSGNTFSANTLNSLQFSYGGGTNNWKGKVKALAVFNEALEDDELELLTGVTNYGSFSELASANGYTII